MTRVSSNLERMVDVNLVHAHDPKPLESPATGQVQPRLTPGARILRRLRPRGRKSGSWAQALSSLSSSG